MKKFALLIALLSGIFMNAQRFDWVSTAGGVDGSSGATAIARDSQGNIYTLNSSNQAQQSQGMSASPAGGTSLFVYKYNTLGEIVYIKPIGTNFKPLNLVVGENDNVYVLGSLMGTSEIRINDQTFIDTENRNYIFKLNPSGNLLWRAKNNVSFGNFTEASMLLFANNHIYFQSDKLSISKLNTNGDYSATLTATAFTSTTSASGVFFRGAGVLSNGDLVFSATSMGTITYGTTVLVPTENSFSHVAMLTIRTTENLNLVWANYTNGLRNPDQNAIPMAIGNDNGIYSGLQISSTLTADPDTITNTITGGSTVGAILKMDADGNKIWVKSTTNNAQIWSILNNPDGTGVFCGGQLFGFQPINLGTTVVNPTTGNSFITKIDYSGVFQNSFNFCNGPIGSYVKSLATDNLGTFYVGGKLNNNTTPVFSCVNRQGNNGLYVGKFTEQPDTAPLPAITTSGNTLTASPVFSGTIQWFLNDQPIADATGQKYNATESGNYKVSYSYIPTCISKSSDVSFAVSDNLILNPSGEEPLVNDKIPHWHETIGSPWLLSTYTVYPLIDTKTSGTKFFYPGNGAVLNEGKMVSELEQNIPLSQDAILIDQGNMNYFFDGYVISFNQSPADQSNIILEFLDANGVLLSKVTFGPYFSVENWTHIMETLLAPVGSRSVNIKLHSVLINGSSNDGLYEDLYFGKSTLLAVSKNIVKESEIVIFPNPSTGIFNIQTNQSIENAFIKVFDLNGRMVHQSKVYNLESKTLDLNNVPSGVYLFNIENEEYNYSQKIIKR